jgi:glutamine amidotransferase PdxT
MRLVLAIMASFVLGVWTGVAGLVYLARRVDDSFKTDAVTVDVVDIHD